MPIILSDCLWIQSSKCANFPTDCAKAPTKKLRLKCTDASELFEALVSSCVMLQWVTRIDKGRCFYAEAILDF